MTMINPSQNLSKQNPQSSVYGYGFGNYESFSLMSRLEEEGCAECYSQQRDCLVRSDLGAQNSSMAEDESRTGSINETGSSSKDINIIQQEAKDKEGNEGWLQLSIGGNLNNNKSEGNSERLVELDLLPKVPSGNIGTNSEQVKSTLVVPTNIFQRQHIPEFRATTSLFLQQNPMAGASSTMFPQENITWGFRPISLYQQQNIHDVSIGSHFIPRPFPVLGVPGPSTNIDFRVIDPPRRPNSGLWFSLQASLNQTKEPFLPQISKSYLRIKDGRMTIRLVLKYLVNKLQLENESEIDITCRGQQLQSFLTLQHVRDHIWSTNAADILIMIPSETSSSSSTTTPSNHVLVLNYGRRSAT